MEWWIAIAPIFLIVLLAIVSAIAGLWRVSAWNMSRTEEILTQHGVSVGARAPELTGHTEDFDIHLTFDGVHTFLIFAEQGCTPCLDLVAAADSHPALANAHLIYASSSAPEFPLSPVVRTWETVRFHNESLARRHWNAPVSPFYHFIDPLGRVIAKGVANKPSHLDHLLQAAPPLITRYGEKYPRDRELSHNGRN